MEREDGGSAARPDSTANLGHMEWVVRRGTTGEDQQVSAGRNSVP